jgi:signal transduction histidine kinase
MASMTGSADVEGGGSPNSAGARTPALSFRTRILLLVLLVSVVPLVLLGLWQARTTARSGEELLRSRLDDVLADATTVVTQRWVTLRSQVLFLAEDPEVQATLSSESTFVAGNGSNESSSAENDVVPVSLGARFEAMDPAVARATVSRANGEPVWRLDRSGAWVATAGSAASLLEIEMLIHARLDGRALGVLSIGLEGRALLPAGSTPPAAAGMVLALLDSDGLPVTATAVDPAVLQGERFQWGGDEWFSARRTVNEPPVTIVVAAPLGPFAAPFREAARRGIWLLVVVALLGLGAAVVLTTRMTRSLQRLSLAAEEVSRGDLEQHVVVGGGGEVARVATAFNSMTASLRRTLAELSNRESLAAVGEFASTLAHEIRNPLTAVQIDLQYVEDELPPGSPLRQPQRKALAEVRRLDATVSDALRVARSGRVDPRPIDLRLPVEAAAAAAAPGFDSRATTLELVLPEEPVWVNGDHNALEQLFLNLMRNAAEALLEGGTATVAIQPSADSVAVLISDTGKGMSEAVRSRVFEPLFSTRREGTGLGLPIARRLAVAHGGEIQIDSEEGKGTSATVTLPLQDPDEVRLASRRSL